MLSAGMSQSELARISGVRQPSISQFVSCRAPFSDDMLERLLACMGYRLEVVRRPVRPDLRRADRTRWLLHRRLAADLDPDSFERWMPRIKRNLDQLRREVRGEPHLSNIDRWERMATDRDLAVLRRAMTGLDQDAIEMREVSPLGGILPQEDREHALAKGAA